jgi:hypothetical protein
VFGEGDKGDEAKQQMVNMNSIIFYIQSSIKQPFFPIFVIINMMKKISVLALLALILVISGLVACNTASNKPLPKSMKGYELYSWQENGQWHFTLITGTNRNKNLEEIISGEEKTGADGWVNLHVTGVDAVKAVLSRIPAGEFVTWLGGQGVVAPAPPADIKLELPSANIIDELKEHAEQCGLEFQTSDYY